MFKKKKNYLKQIYKMNPDTNAYIIEVSLIDYNEIFNGWDPSPIKRRDVDPELISFLEECDSDIPLEFPLELMFYLPEDQYDNCAVGHQVRKRSRWKTSSAARTGDAWWRHYSIFTATL